MAPTKLTQYFDKIEILLILKHLKNRISASHLTVDGNFWLSSRISLKMLQIQRIIQEYSTVFFFHSICLIYQWTGKMDNQNHQNTVLVRDVF